jgi:hypothetical protein
MVVTDQRNESHSKNESAALVSPKKKSSGGVFQKTRDAFGIVNSKLINNVKKADLMDMMPLESNSSFDFDPERDLDKEVAPLKDGSGREPEIQTKDETKLDSHVSPNETTQRSVQSSFKEAETGHISSPSSSKLLTSKKYTRNTARNSGSSSQPHRSKSSGNAQRKSKHKSFSSDSIQTSPGRLKRHLSVPINVAPPVGGSASPGILRRPMASPNNVKKEHSTTTHLPKTPTLNAKTYGKELLDKPGQGIVETETSWQRVSQAFESDNGTMGGYFAKLLEKMEVEGESPGNLQTDTNDEDGAHDQKKNNKFKTPKGLRKFFSIGRSSHEHVSAEDTGIVPETNPSDIDMFTAFISSPTAVDSPARTARKHVPHSFEDASDTNLDDFPEIPTEKQTRLDDIRREVNCDREGSLDDLPTHPSNPKLGHTKTSTRRSPADYTLKASDVRRGPIKDPGSPGKSNSTHRRGGKRESFDYPSKLQDESIPRHSMSNRRTRTLRPIETKTSSNEQVSRSSHRSRRSRTSSSLSSPDQQTNPDPESDLKEDLGESNETKAEEDRQPSSRCVSEAPDPPDIEQSSRINDRSASASKKDNAPSRRKRISSGRIDTKGVSLHSAHGRHKRTTGSNRSDRPSERSNTDLSHRTGESSNTIDARTQGSMEKDSVSDQNKTSHSKSLLVQSLGSEPFSPSISRRTRPGHSQQKQALLMRASSMSNVHKGSVTTRDVRRPTSLRITRHTSESKLGTVNEMTAECGGEMAEEDLLEDDDEHLFSRAKDTPLSESKKKLPSLAESLERGSELNIRLFDDGQETVMTDDGSLWFEQGSISGLEIKSSASIAAPQLVFDHTMTRIVEHA